ncbi:MAG: DHA2 family efflux MFS transporter permease subunit [Alphaproteobacteria bacterium]|nr:DHA2 family efflux MFS transporter permease subunit [Alphaproteobacteria bacterium]
MADLMAQHGRHYRWFIVATAILGTFAQVLASTTINVAIPEIMGAFALGHDQAQWLSTGFLAATTIAMLITAWLVERFGFKATFVGAIVVFETGSFLGGFAPNIDLLIFGRVLQGAASGVIQPLSMLTVFQVFSPHQRGTAMGLFGIGTILAPSLGPTLAGMLIDELGWQFVFFMGTPFDFIGILAALAFLPGRLVAQRRGFDWTGCGLLVIAVAFILVGLTDGQRLGWADDSVTISLVVGFGGFAAFLVWETVVRHPLVNLRVFRHYQFAAATAVSFVIGAALFSTTYLVPLFVQTIQGYDAMHAGLLMLPGGLAIGLVFPLAGYLSDKVPNFYLISSGLLLIALSSFLLISIDTATDFWTLVWWTVIGRLGFAFIFPSLGIGSLRALPPDEIAQGSGIINFSRQLGGAFGVNALATALIANHAFYDVQFSATQSGANSVTADAIRHLSVIFRQLGAAEVLIQPSALAYLSNVVDIQANMMSYREGFLLVTVVALLAMVPAFLMVPRRGASRLACPRRLGSLPRHRGQ